MSANDNDLVYRWYRASPSEYTQSIKFRGLIGAVAQEYFSVSGHPDATDPNYQTPYARFYVESYFDGNVGIGTTDPDTNLHINDTTATTTLFLESGGTGLGGRIIIEDTDGAGCSVLTTLDGVLTVDTIACP